MSIVLPNGFWAPAWTPNSGPLVLSFTNSQAIGALWLPIVPAAIAVALTPTPAAGNPAYTANADGSNSGAETIPIPPGVTIVRLTAAYPSPIYVFVSSLPFNPFKGNASTMTQSGNLTGVPADGSALVHVSYLLPFGSKAAPVVTASWGGVAPSGPLIANTANETLNGFDIYITGGAPGSTCNANWDSNGV